MKKLIDTVTFCKRIGKLVIGFDLVKKAMSTGEAQLVLLSEDLSDKTKKEAEYLCRTFEMPWLMIPLTLDELWYLIGKRAGVLAVTDVVFAEKIHRIIKDDTNTTMQSEKEDTR
jgi:ribosomal protein L7Ae-like RNA K-turn-binding protein